MAASRLLGAIVRLQLQPESLKREVDGRRVYDPAGLRTVPELCLTPTGASTVPSAADGAVAFDVHNTRHPRSKIWGPNFLSFGFTAHYAALTAEFGPHVTLGCAGENIVIATDLAIPPEQVAGGIWIATAAGPVRLQDVTVAEPCKPFAEFILQGTGSTPARLKTTLQFLQRGRRGFYCRYPDPVTALVRLGDSVYASD